MTPFTKLNSPKFLERYILALSLSNILIIFRKIKTKIVFQLFFKILKQKSSTVYHPWVIIIIIKNKTLR